VTPAVLCSGSSCTAAQQLGRYFQCTGCAPPATGIDNLKGQSHRQSQRQFQRQSQRQFQRAISKAVSRANSKAISKAQAKVTVHACNFGEQPFHACRVEHAHVQVKIQFLILINTFELSLSQVMPHMWVLICVCETTLFMYAQARQ